MELLSGMGGAGGNNGVQGLAAGEAQAALDVASAPADAALSDPAIRARYHVVEAISPGVEDALYLARRVDTGALVDLRILSGGLGGDRLLRAALVQQATLVARIAGDCPGIATAYECERTDGGAFVLPLEHPDGPTLRQVIKQAGTLELKRALRVAMRIGEVLERVHSLGLVHGGLRADNVVLVGLDESVVLKHLGFDWIVSSRSPAAAARQGSAPEDSGGRAPEQAWDQATERSDVYAFGAVLYEMLSGARPPTASRRRVGPTSLQNHRADITPGLERIVTQTLQVAPERRPADISAVCNALNEELAAIDRKSAGSESGRHRRMSKATMQLVGWTGAAALVALAVWLGHARMGPGPWSSRLPGLSVSARTTRPVTTSSAQVDAPGPGSAPEQEIDAASSVTLAPQAPAASSASAPMREATTTQPPVNAVGKRDAAGRADAVTKGDSGGNADAAGKALAPPSPPTVVAPARPLRPKADERGLAMQPGPRAEEATRAGGVSPNRAVERREAPTIQRREVPAARPSTDTGNAADDPGAIIDWLLGEGSGKDR